MATNDTLNPDAEHLNHQQLLATGIAALPRSMREVELPYVLSLANLAARLIRAAPAAHRNTLMLAHMAELARGLRGDGAGETVQ